MHLVAVDNTSGSPIIVYRAVADNNTSLVAFNSE